MNNLFYFWAFCCSIMAPKQKKYDDILVGFINLLRNKIFKSVELAVMLQLMNNSSICLEIDSPSL